MTTKINLLPWREERRKELQQEFIAILAGAAILGGLIFFAWNSAVTRDIENQQARNKYIEKQLGLLDQQISEIKELEQRREELVERMKVIQDLQGNRPTIVYIFDQLVRTLPDGVYYTEVSRQGNVFTVSGVAESNNRISRLMRNLSESVWFSEPALSNVTAVEGAQGAESGEQANRFVLTVRQSTPQKEEEVAE